MPYIGQRPSKGDENNFKILDDISSYTLTFDGSDSSVVSAANDTITSLTHRFVQGQRVTYTDGDGSAIAGLTDATVYFIIKEDHNTIKLATSASNAANGTAVNITGVGAGSSHTLNVAFDGVNTKFKATHTNGQKARITRSAQLVISMNGVIQQPHDTATPSTGFGFDLDGTIVFSQAPVSSDVFWSHVLTNNNVTFDISDNDIDNFTGDGSTVSFNLSKTPPDNRNILVTVDGVVQYPNDPDGTVRSYNVVENVLTFAIAPPLDVQIQVRHIGFAGSTSGGSSGVTNFYGRTGSVVLTNSDNITVNDAAITGDATVTGNLTVNGTTTTLDTQLVEVDKIEVETAGTNVAVAVTHNGSGDLIRLHDGTSQVVTVDDEGKIGINSTSPTQKLDVNGTSSFQGEVQIKSGNQIKLSNNANSANTTIDCDGGARLHLKSYSESVATFEEGVGTIFYQGSGTNRLQITPTGGIHVGAGGTIYVPDKISHVGDTDSSIRFPAHGQFSFETNGYERFKFTETDATLLNYQGNHKVGIGTDVLVAKLDVKNNANIPVLKLNDSHFNKYLTIQGGGSPNRMIIDAYEGGGGGAAIDLASNGETKLSVLSSGNVGINTSTVTTGQDRALTVYGTTGGELQLKAANFGGGGSGEGASLTYSYGSLFLTNNSTNGDIHFSTKKSGESTTEKMRISESGLVGIGTVNPSQLLSLYSASPRIQLTHTTSPASNCFIDYAATGVLELSVDDNDVSAGSKLQIRMDGAAAAKLTIDEDGQVGINRTPKTWYSNYTSLQIHDGGYIVGSADDSFVAIGANNYLDSGGTYDYTNSDYASQLYQVDGKLIFRNAASGTADNAISWSEKLNIDTSGKAVFRQDAGATNNTYSIVAELNAKTSGSAAANFGPALYLSHTFGNSNYAGSLITSQTNSDVNTTDIIFYPRNYGWTQALRIDFRGNIGINTTTSLPAYSKLSIDHGAFGLTRISNHSHLLVQNKNAGTDHFWSLAPRDNGSISLARGPVDANGTVNDVHSTFSISSAGRVGIGSVANSSASFLEMSSTSGAEAYPFATENNNVQSYSPFNHEVTIRNNTLGQGNNFCGICFLPGAHSDGNRISAARISAIDAGDYRADLTFGTRGYRGGNIRFQEVLKLDSNGHAELKTGNLAFANGAGVDFSNVPDGGRSVGSNLLNDYEEGTYTAADASGAGLSITNVNNGKYTKIGRMVILTFDITYPTTSDTNISRITSPFAASTGYGNGWVGWTELGRPMQIHVSGSNVYFMDCNASGTGKHLYNNELSGLRFIGGFIVT